MPCPNSVERLHGDRTDPAQLVKALHGRSFDAVVDNALYKGAEVEPIVRLFNHEIGRYLFLSTGQVYLVREGAPRPFTEGDYDGRLMPPPKPNTFGYEEWMYGIEKRRAEDALQLAYEQQGFPYTSLRLPMVNSERDHFHRLYNYILRFERRQPRSSRPRRRITRCGTFTRAMSSRRLLTLLDSGKGIGRAYNISQDETLPLDEFIGILGDLLGVEAEVVRVRRDLLEANGFLPDCSPFSERWMSELDNARSKRELGLSYTPVREYLKKIVHYYQENPPGTPASYRRRRAELLLLEHSESLV